MALARASGASPAQPSHCTCDRSPAAGTSGRSEGEGESAAGPDRPPPPATPSSGRDDVAPPGPSAASDRHAAGPPLQGTGQRGAGPGPGPGRGGCGGAKGSTGSLTGWPPTGGLLTGPRAGSRGSRRRRRPAAGFSGLGLSAPWLALTAACLCLSPSLSAGQLASTISAPNQPVREKRAAKRAAGGFPPRTTDEAPVREGKKGKTHPIPHRPPLVPRRFPPTRTTARGTTRRTRRGGWRAPPRSGSRSLLTPPTPSLGARWCALARSLGPLGPLGSLPAIHSLLGWLAWRACLFCLRALIRPRLCREQRAARRGRYPPPSSSTRSWAS